MPTLMRLAATKRHTPEMELGMTKKHKRPLDETVLWSRSLQTLLQSKCGQAMFLGFLKSEHSDENLAFWAKCEAYKGLLCPFRLKKLAKVIYKRFIEEEAPDQINIDQRTREQIRETVLTQPSRACFNEAQQIVFGLMERDSYPRFLRSELYRTLTAPTLERKLTKH